MSRHRVKNIHFPVFVGYEVTVVVSDNIKKAMLKYPQSREIEVDETMACAVHVDPDAWSFIFLKHKALPGTIAHECWHVVKRMMEHMGIDLDSETCAYHLGYLVNEIYPFVHGRGKHK